MRHGAGRLEHVFSLGLGGLIGAGMLKMFEDFLCRADHLAHSGLKWFDLKTESGGVRHARVKSNLSHLKARSLIRNISESEYVVTGGIEFKNALLGSLKPPFPLVSLTRRLYQSPDIVKSLSMKLQTEQDDCDLQ